MRDEANNPQTLDIAELLEVSMSFSWEYYKTSGHTKILMPKRELQHKASGFTMFNNALDAQRGCSF